MQEQTGQKSEATNHDWSLTGEWFLDYGKTWSTWRCSVCGAVTMLEIGTTPTDEGLKLCNPPPKKTRHY